MASFNGDYGAIERLVYSMRTTYDYVSENTPPAPSPPPAPPCDIAGDCNDDGNGSESFQAVMWAVGLNAGADPPSGGLHLSY